MSRLAAIGARLQNATPDGLRAGRLHWELQAGGGVPPRRNGARTSYAGRPGDRPSPVGPSSAALAFVIVMWAAAAAAQLGPRPPFQPAPVPQEGLHYFAIQNLNTAQFEQRGIAGANGIAFSNLILRPDTPYRIWIIQARTLAVADATVITPGNGQRFDVPPLGLRVSNSRDRDGDGLHDDGELILGTINDPTNPDSKDSDGDGVLDGAEVLQGLDPLDGVAVRTGLIGTADTPGTALDVCAFDDVVVIADGAAGITVFNVFNGMQPLAIAQIDTPGAAERVACAGLVVAVADGDSGLAVIDITDPPAARIVHQVDVRGRAQAVTAGGGIAYVGLASGEVVSVDLASGTILERLQLARPVQDLTLSGDAVYVLTDDTLVVIVLSDGLFEVTGSLASPLPGGLANKRVFVAGDTVHAVHGTGVNTFDVSDPALPSLIATGSTAQRGWKQIVLNGSGLGVAAVSPNLTLDGPHDVSLYDTSDPTQTDRFVTTFETPGIARAVSIFNGIAYVADGDAGMQVANYLAFDTDGIPPTISLRTNFAVGAAEEGQVFRITAEVGDDVQVRNVEFYIDGVKVATDGNFPFEHRFVTPLIRDKASFILQARASDTGGNATLTDEIVVTLIPDARPPRVVRTAPGTDAVVPAISVVAAFFNEPIDPTTLTSASFGLVRAGPDGELGTADDVAVAGTVEFREDVRAAFRTMANPLAPERYRATLSTLISDLAGNGLIAPTQWDFRVFDVGADRDLDGVPDDLEPELGLDPDDADSDDDGTPDGDEDFDNDGLNNFGEVRFGTDPTDADSDDDGVNDGDEDGDNDDLTDGEEARRGTDPRSADTDADGWPDGAEVDAGSSPTTKSSQPRFTVVANPLVSVVVPVAGDVDGLATNTTVASPPVSVVLQALEIPEDFPPNVTVAQPPVSVVVQAVGQVEEGLAANTTVARPPVAVVVQAEGNANGLAPNTTVAQPPVSVRISGQ